jgi:hypothetical protein
MLLRIVVGQPSVTTNYLAQFNSRAAQMPQADTAWPLYRQCLIDLKYKPTAEYPTGVNTLLTPGDDDWPALV